MLIRDALADLPTGSGGSIKPIVIRRFIEVECCMKCPNKFPTMSNQWRCKAKDGVYPLPEQGVHIDCPLPILNGV